MDVIDLSSFIIEQPYGSVRSPPGYVFDAVRETLTSGWPNPSLRGLPSFRKVIAEHEGKERGMDVDPDSEVLVTSGGSMQGIYNVLQTVLDPGDEAVVFTPGMPYDEHVKLAGAKPVYVDLTYEDGYRFNRNAIENVITPRTKLLILNTPHNPTGYIAKRNELEEVADLVKQHDLLVLSDEVLWKWVYNEHRHISFASLPGMMDYTILLNSVTKVGMFDWRIGWIIARAGLIEEIEKVMFYQTEFSPPIAQVAAEAHLSQLDNWIAPIVQDHQRKMGLLHNGLREAGLPCFKPEGHLTAFPSITALNKSSTTFAEYLLEHGHVLVAPGVLYLGEEHLRVGFGGQKDEEIMKGVERIKEVIRKYQSSFA